MIKEFDIMEFEVDNKLNLAKGQGKAAKTKGVYCRL